MKSEQIIANANSAVLKIAGRYLKDVKTAILTGAYTDLTYEQIDSIEVTRNSPEAR
ncbi:MAG: hypothetical protein QNJ38_15455 [Prochloraceae cyanobacterium]|nr:hypothetical protein [Prochloraceae cyanobacterium]